MLGFYSEGPCDPHDAPKIWAIDFLQDYFVFNLGGNLWNAIHFKVEKMGTAQVSIFLIFKQFLGLWRKF